MQHTCENGIRTDLAGLHCKISAAVHVLTVLCCMWQPSTDAAATLILAKVHGLDKPGKYLEQVLV